ncbi:MAG: cellulase family glycosylhydrolase [Deferribacteres bacterium]|nr:cellulase family glycosylhydrolase [Deferribacteres bacterium]
MKRLTVLACLLVATTLQAQIPFKRGINLTEWFQKADVRQIQFSKFNRETFARLQTMGFDHVRLPIRLHDMTSGAPDYTIEPLFFDLLDRVVDWTEELGLHLIIDNHTFSVTDDTDPNIINILLPVWTQMAEHYAPRSSLIYYEILNEPHGISDSIWNLYQQKVIEAIRTVDQKHAIIVGPAEWNSYNNLDLMPAFADTNLLYTFHFYDPFIFTHQGANWSMPSLQELRGVPFPYDVARMPDLPSSYNGTWIEDVWQQYSNEGTVAHVQSRLNIAVAFQQQRNVRMFCGELGVLRTYADTEDRVKWYKAVREYLEANGIGWTMWDYTGGFGLFEAGTDELFESDLNIPLIEALGLTPPEQHEFEVKPDSVGLEMYDDFFGPNIRESSSIGNGTLDYYAETAPAQGSYCIHWSGVSQYSHIGFNFVPNRDLSQLVDRGFALEFHVRGDSPGASFDVRFIDTKTVLPDDHPWRMRHLIDESVARWDGEWHKVRIPLKDFLEHGAWDDGWYSPIGAFDWTAIDRFEIVAEHHDLTGMQFWIDDIRIIDPQLSSIALADIAPTSFVLQQNYPNPFNPTTTIHFELPKNSSVQLAIFAVNGQLVRELVYGEKSAGRHSVRWDGTNAVGQRVASGVYWYRLSTEDVAAHRKLLLMK